MNVSWVKDHLGKSLFVALTLFALTFSAYKIGEKYAWLTSILSLIALILILWVYRSIDIEARSKELSSNDWFKSIAELLNDASQANIYLRHFQHPDEFTDKHRSELMRIMKAFAIKMAEHTENFRIIAYRPSDSKGKDPVEWLRQEIKETRGDENANLCITKCITIIDSQPTANSSTVYLIDNFFLLYNRLLDNHQFKYYKVDFSRSIIPYFLNLGFANFSNSISRL